MNPRPAFTLIELLVVVTIIVGLLAMLAPALDGAIEQAQRAACGANERAIYLGSYGYAMGHKKKLIPCRNYNGPPKIQIAFEDDYAQSLADAGLMGSSKAVVATNSLDSLTTYPPSKVWDCPARGFKSRWGSTAKGNAYEDATAALGWQLVIGYQYLGGIATWTNPQYTGGTRSRSPVDIAKSGPGWVLAADTTAKIGGAWGGTPTDDYAGMPSHKSGDSWRPAGGNQVHMDGSVAWIQFNRMLYISSWTGGQDRKFFWYQSDLGFEPGDLLRADLEP